MATFDEKTTVYVTVNPKDKAGAAAAPSSGDYNVRDVESDTEIVADTAISPLSTSMEITLLGATVNALQDTANKVERRKVTVKLGYGGSDTLNSEYEYKIRNLSGV